MAQAARRTPALPDADEEAPSLDPMAIEHAYRRERHRRRVRLERRSAARRSRVRFWITLFVLIFATAFIVLASWHKVQTMFGI
jgi:hypothetical protein